MKIVLIGIQGAGKSTQGNLLSKQLKIPYLSTGHIFREIAKEKTTLGRWVKEILNSGQLIPDEKTIEIVNSYLSRPEYKNGYILDGFPRTVNQAKKFKNHVDKVVHLEIPDKEALWRLAGRNDNDRGDNTLTAIKKRIELFHKFTEPVLAFYEKENKYAEIDGTQSIEEVNEEILKSLGKQVVENQVKSWEKKGKTIIAITGLPGAGKTEAAVFLKEKGLPSVSFGKVINEYIENHGLPHSEKEHNEVRTMFRQKYGMAALAVLNEKKIKDLLKKSNMMVAEGMRSWEEYIYLKEKMPKVRIVLVTVYADKELRYSRISHRKDRNQLAGEKRDVDELIGTNMGPTIAFSDFLIKNNFSMEEFHDKLEEVYREIYFA